MIVHMTLSFPWLRPHHRNVHDLETDVQLLLQLLIQLLGDDLHQEVPQIIEVLALSRISHELNPRHWMGSMDISCEKEEYNEWKDAGPHVASLSERTTP